MNVAIIPARGNSKSVARKNLQPIGGKPMLQWTIDAAKESGVFDRVVLTSEDSEIQQLGVKNGITVLVRPQYLSLDWVQSSEVALDALRQLQLANVNPDIVTILQPTSPFRTVQDIQLCAGAFDGWHSGWGDDIGTLLSVYKSYKYHWHSEEYSATPLYHNPQKRLGRQWEEDMGMYVETGSIYIVLAERFGREGMYRLPPYKMISLPEEHGLDIDGQTDLQLAVYLYEKRKK